jgi:PleD family two-component response regulator
VLSGCNGAHLKESAEEVRKAVSLGAIAIENWNKSTLIEPLLKQADAALYQVKTSGRNRVIYAEAFVAV